MERRARLFVAALIGVSVFAGSPPATAQEVSKDPIDYLVLATNRTSTMDKEMNEAADGGYRFGGVMGGDTAFGGSEVVAIMTRRPGDPRRYQYRLLATSRTSTMQKEMQEAGDAGYEYRGQTVFKTSFGGQETVVILERDTEIASPRRFEYRLLATNRTSTMQNELREAGTAGFEFVGVTVASTRLGGNEVVSILRREAP
jgi:hypothetical protein